MCLPKSPGSGIQGSPSSPDCDRDPRALFWLCAPPARSPRTFQPRAPPARGSQRQAKHPNQVDNPRVLSQLNGPLQLCCRDYQNTHATTLPQRCCRGCPSCAERPLASTRGRNAPKAPALPPLATPIATAPPLHTYHDRPASLCSASRPPHPCAPPPRPPGGCQAGAAYPSRPVPGGHRGAGRLLQPRAHRDTAMSRRGFTGQDFYRGFLESEFKPKLTPTVTWCRNWEQEQNKK